MTKLVDKPCVIGDQKLCRHFAYPKLDGRATADASNLVTTVSSYIDDTEVSFCTKDDFVSIFESIF